MVKIHKEFFDEYLQKWMLPNDILKNNKQKEKDKLITTGVKVSYLDPPFLKNPFIDCQIDFAPCSENFLYLKFLFIYITYEIRTGRKRSQESKKKSLNKLFRNFYFHF